MTVMSSQQGLLSLICLGSNWLILGYANTIDSKGFKGGTRGAPIMPRDAVSWTAHVGTVGTNGNRLHFSAYGAVFALLLSIKLNMHYPNLIALENLF